MWGDRRWLNLPSMAPHNLWTARRKVEVQPWTYMAYKKSYAESNADRVLSSVMPPPIAIVYKLLRHTA